MSQAHIIFPESLLPVILEAVMNFQDGLSLSLRTEGDVITARTWVGTRDRGVAIKTVSPGGQGGLLKMNTL